MQVKNVPLSKTHTVNTAMSSSPTKYTTHISTAATMKQAQKRSHIPYSTVRLNSHPNLTPNGTKLRKPLKTQPKSLRNLHKQSHNDDQITNGNILETTRNNTTPTLKT
ncbi:unnamed protein product [Rotaria socialis]|uniref:Uncharacterized protein n=2 Tax=Rotaria socialis TaxID=392032 RepID=A0A818HEJ9_9BILA|nr:unnamed protein product [Rotaria socialis]CAF4894379.1 unnamed protein product [Rotaria socialis]